MRFFTLLIDALKKIAEDDAKSEHPQSVDERYWEELDSYVESLNSSELAAHKSSELMRTKAIPESI